MLKQQPDHESNQRFRELNVKLTAIQRAQALKTQQHQFQQQHRLQSQAQPQQRQPDGPPQPGPTGQQSSPVMNASLRLQENGQVNGRLSSDTFV